jgi:23S rRNA pseudouridine2457 synthase
VGRLDADSEGLLLLTNDKRVNSKLLLPSNKHNRKYLVQVEGDLTEEAINLMEKGMVLNDKGNIYKTLPAEVKKILEIDIPTSWLEIKLQEGKNRQIRKMTAAAGFPTLRLIRMEIEKIRLEKMEIGWVKEIKKDDFYRDLNIKY